MADPRKPVLSLSTLIERRFIDLDGKQYELRNAEEFGLLTAAQIQHKSDRMAEVFKDLGGELTDELVAQSDEDLDWLCRKVLIAPEEVHQVLTHTHRMAILLTFIKLQQEQKAPPAGAKKRLAVKAPKSETDASQTTATPSPA